MGSNRPSWLAVAALSLVLAPTPMQASVLTGPVVNPANGHRYYLLTSSSWTAAESEAVTLGGHLVTINNQAENDFVFDTFAPQISSNIDAVMWIGYNDAAVEGTFAWASGESSTYTKWGLGEPNNDPGWGGEDYVAIHIHPLNILLPRDWNDINLAGSSQVPFGVVEVIPEQNAAALAALTIATFVSRRAARPRGQRGGVT